jgi:hypothetical protein
MLCLAWNGVSYEQNGERANVTGFQGAPHATHGHGLAVRPAELTDGSVQVSTGGVERCIGILQNKTGLNTTPSTEQTLTRRKWGGIVGLSCRVGLM